MNVGLLTYGVGRSARGISRYTVELARALAENPSSPEITLLQTEPAGPLDSAGFRKILIPRCRKIPGLLTAGNVIIPRLARALRLDVIHDPTGVAPFLFGAASAKIILTLHDAFPFSFPGVSSVVEKVIYRYWLPVVLPRVDAIITPSLCSRGDILRFLPVSPDRIHVIPYGTPGAFRVLPREKVRRHLAERYGLVEPFILYVGAIEQRKNVGRLVQAFANLMGDFPKLRLVLAGPRIGKDKTWDSIFADKRMEKRILWTGPKTELAALYNGCEVFVFPSLYEGFGLPPVEAMACGAPVVCSNRASLPEVVGDAALMVDPMDTQAIADAMREILTNEHLRKKMRKKGLQQARTFSWKRNAEQTMAVYQEILRPSPLKTASGVREDSGKPLSEMNDHEKEGRFVL